VGLFGVSEVLRNGRVCGKRWRSFALSRRYEGFRGEDRMYRGMRF
jgi:hypothetical protein